MSIPTDEELRRRGGEQPDWDESDDGDVLLVDIVDGKAVKTWVSRAEADRRRARTNERASGTS